MISSPRVTVGVPVYNGEATLQETLDSLLAQDHADFEVVISDNASSDGTEAIARGYADRDPRVRYVRHAENVGAARNYNHLVGLARGELFKWHSADDLAGPTLLSRCVEALDSRPDAVLAYPRTVLVDQAGEPLRDHIDGMHLPQPDPARRLRQFALRRALCNPCFGVIRVSAMSGTGLIRPYVSSDITFLAELVAIGPVIEVPERLFFRRVAPTSCGLGGLSRREVTHWFDPSRRAGLLPPLVRVFVDVVMALLSAPTMSPPDRIRASLWFSDGWLRRQAGISLWRLRRRIRGGRRTSVYHSMIGAEV